MFVLRTTRHRFTLPLAALLLVLQGAGGGAVALAHADERSSAPAAFEAHHTASCPVVHDASRCALYQYAGLRVAPSMAQPSAATRPMRPSITEPRSRFEFTRHLTAPPRAPPFVS
jgi:hypothetical protein